MLSSSGAAVDSAPARTPSLRFQATVEVLQNLEVVWQKPPTPRGTLFVAHGCGHAAVDWWPKSDSCPLCIGLPEEVNITARALLRGYAIVAVSSRDREGRRCWRTQASADTADDLLAVPQVLEILLAREGLASLPLYAMGASSGGAFALHLAATYARIAGTCSQIMSVSSEKMGQMVAGRAAGLAGRAAGLAGPTRGVAPTTAAAGRYPPTMFVHMPLDTYTAEEVVADVDVLKKLGVPVQVIEIPPTPMTPTYLFEHSPQTAPGVPGPEFSKEVSVGIFNAMQKAGILGSDGKLLRNPRGSEWRSAVMQAQIAGMNQERMQSDQSAMSELLNVLFAGHEIISSTTDAMLDFFEAHGVQGAAAAGQGAGAATTSAAA